MSLLTNRDGEERPCFVSADLAKTRMDQVLGLFGMLSDIRLALRISPWWDYYVKRIEEEEEREQGTGDPENH